jgi:hypothetical protein
MPTGKSFAVAVARASIEMLHKLESRKPSSSDVIGFVRVWKKPARSYTQTKDFQTRKSALSWYESLGLLSTVDKGRPGSENY